MEPPHVMDSQSMGSHMGNRSWREAMLSSETIASTLPFSCQFFLPEVPTQTPFFSSFDIDAAGQVGTEQLVLVPAEESD